MIFNVKVFFSVTSAYRKQMKYGGSTSSNLQLTNAKEFEFLSSVVSEEIEKYWTLLLKKSRHI